MISKGVSSVLGIVERWLHLAAIFWLACGFFDLWFILALLKGDVFDRWSRQIHVAQFVGVWSLSALITLIPLKEQVLTLALLLVFRASVQRVTWAITPLHCLYSWSHHFLGLSYLISSTHFERGYEDCHMNLQYITALIHNRALREKC